MTAQRAALRRVKAFLATFTAKDDGQRFCATAIDSTFTKPRLVKFTVADLRAVLALAERAVEAAIDLHRTREALAPFARMADGTRRPGGAGRARPAARREAGEAVSECELACWAMPDCARCGRRKHPRGRDPGLYAASGYCGHDCEGFDEEPRSGHYWPNEEPERKEAARRREEGP